MEEETNRVQVVPSGDDQGSGHRRDTLLQEQECATGIRFRWVSSILYYVTEESEKNREGSLDLGGGRSG